MKKEYCVFILRELHGKETYADERKIVWKLENATIECRMLFEGKDKYTGGNIRIVIENAV